MANSKFRSQFLESRLEVREVQLQLASEAADLGTWTWEPATGELTLSRRCQALLAVRADEPALLDTLIAHIHPDDQLRVKRALNSALQLKTEFSIEFRVILPGNEARRLSLSGRTHASVAHKNQPALSGVLREARAAHNSTRERLSTRFRSLANQIESLRKVERNALTSRLKSEVSRCLATLKHELTSLSHSTLITPALSSSLNELAAEAEAGLESLRRTIFELQPPGVEEMGFAGALERYATEHAARAGMTVSLSIPPDPIAADHTALLALYAVAQAGIDNVILHANARHMDVSVTATSKELRLRIVDNGNGMQERDLLKAGAFSLLAASEQLAHSGGRLKTIGIPPQGTTLEARVPAHAAARRAPLQLPPAQAVEAEG